jgi:hypothetical protein
MTLLPVATLPPLFLVTLLLFVASLYGLSAVGHFPRVARQEALLSGIGPFVLWGTMVVVGLAVVVALLAAWWLIPWYAAIIGGGIAILVAPLGLQYFSDAFVDGPRALLYFAAAAAIIAAALGLWLPG